MYSHCGVPFAFFLIYAASLPGYDAAKVIDLTHVLNEGSPKWPSNPEGFMLKVDSNQTSAGGYWFSSNSLSFGEHTGTHLDAPIHFANFDGVYFSNTIPSKRLVCPVALINMREKLAAHQRENDNPDLLLSAAHIQEYEDKYGRIKADSVVLLNFGWSQHYNNWTAYFGTDTNDTSLLHFPGIGIDAAEVFVERQIAGVGLDTPSIDFGPSSDFTTHVLLLGNNIYGLENVGDMSQLPDGGLGVTLFIGAMKTEYGSGGPVRLLAVVEEPDTSSASTVSCCSVAVLLLSVLLVNKAA